ncbi:MAG: hypothetical protein LBF63_01360 [Treponema sp.]|jgi:hypothetical protein|nr:hypothetical protein [Treponema sp.]
MNKALLFAIGWVCMVFINSSCSSIQAGIYLLSIDKEDGENILKKEIMAREYLETVLEKPNSYTISAYERCAVNYQIKRTKLVTHSYYVITETGTGVFHTISFYGTKIAISSEGAWAIDSDSDLASYISFLDGTNNWDVIEIYIKNGINTGETVRNILRKIDSRITYYYNDHIYDRPNVDNCNTALWETIVKR